MAEEKALEQRLQALGLDVSPEEFVESLPPPVRRRVEALQELQSKHDELAKQFRKELAELEAKYEKQYAPLYKERADIVSGDKAVPAKEGEENTTADGTPSGVPEFWSTVLLKCDTTCQLIKDKDIAVLTYLKDIQSSDVVKDGNPCGFKLDFMFADNPFFTNKVLSKTYFMAPDDDEMLEKSEGTTINWNQGKDVTVKIMKKKPKKGGKAESKPQFKTEKVDSFFNFFNPPAVPNEDDEIDEEEMEELQAAIEMDYEIGLMIKEKLIPDAVSWYTGEATGEDEPFFYGDDGGEDDEDEDEDLDEDDDDNAPPKAKKGGAAGGEQAPECKQQ